MDSIFQNFQRKITQKKKDINQPNTYFNKNNKKQKSKNLQLQNQEYLESKFRKQNKQKYYTQQKQISNSTHNFKSYTNLKLVNPLLVDRVSPYEVKIRQAIQSKYKKSKIKAFKYVKSYTNEQTNEKSNQNQENVQNNQTKQDSQDSQNMQILKDFVYLKKQQYINIHNFHLLKQKVNQDQQKKRQSKRKRQLRINYYKSKQKQQNRNNSTLSISVRDTKSQDSTPIQALRQDKRQERNDNQKQEYQKQINLKQKLRLHNLSLKQNQSLKKPITSRNLKYNNLTSKNINNRVSNIKTALTMMKNKKLTSTKNDRLNNKLLQKQYNYDQLQTLIQDQNIINQLQTYTPKYSNKNHQEYREEGEKPLLQQIQKKYKKYRHGNLSTSNQQQQFKNINSQTKFNQKLFSQSNHKNNSQKKLLISSARKLQTDSLRTLQYSSSKHLKDQYEQNKRLGIELQPKHPKKLYETTQELKNKIKSKKQELSDQMTNFCKDNELYIKKLKQKAQQNIQSVSDQKWKLQQISFKFKPLSFKTIQCEKDYHQSSQKNNNKELKKYKLQSDLINQPQNRIMKNRHHTIESNKNQNYNFKQPANNYQNKKLNQQILYSEKSKQKYNRRKLRIKTDIREQIYDNKDEDSINSQPKFIKDNNGSINKNHYDSSLSNDLRRNNGNLSTTNSYQINKLLMKGNNKQKGIKQFQKGDKFKFYRNIRNKSKTNRFSTIS